MLTTQDPHPFAADFARLQQSERGPAWLRALREAAMARFNELGFPTMRDEDWRSTPIDTLARTAFTAPPQRPTIIMPGQLEAFEFPGLRGTRLVFIDGRYAPDLSIILPLRATVTGLGDALESHGEIIRKHLAQYEDHATQTFSALNTAFLDDGAFIHVPRQVALDEPIHLLYISTTHERPTATHPRNLIVVETGGQATVIEDYVSIGEGATFSNAVTELVAGPSSTVSHYLLERENTQSINIATLRVQQDRESDFTSHSVLLGGALVRNNVHPVLAGKGCQSVLNGLYVTSGSQHVDNHMRVEHAKPHCDSRQFYTGILNDRSKAVFTGRIVVHKDAQKTDAKQTNNNLLLSDDAQADTKPQLEIYADDVKCTHGATVGRMNQEGLFYMCSRGIPKEQARAMLIYAFASEAVGRMKVQPIREALEATLMERLSLGQQMEAVL